MIRMYLWFIPKETTDGHGCDGSARIKNKNIHGNPFNPCISVVSYLVPFRIQRATFNVQPSTCNLQRATLNVQPYNVQPSTCNPQRATFNVQPSTCNLTTCNLQRATFNVQPYNVQPSTCNLQRATFNAQPSTRNLQPACPSPTAAPPPPRNASRRDAENARPSRTRSGAQSRRVRAPIQADRPVRERHSAR
jgi:hypothetical protein